MQERKPDQHTKAIEDCLSCARENNIGEDRARECSLSAMVGCVDCPHVPVTLKLQAE